MRECNNVVNETTKCTKIYHFSSIFHVLLLMFTGDGYVRAFITFISFTLFIHKLVHLPVGDIRDRVKILYWRIKRIHERRNIIIVEAFCNAKRAALTFAL